MNATHTPKPEQIGIPLPTVPGETASAYRARLDAWYAERYDTLRNSRDALIALIEEVLRAGNSNTRAIKQAMGTTWSRDARAALKAAKGEA